MRSVLLNYPTGRAITDSAERYEVSVVLPCLNEAATVGTCVAKGLEALRRLAVRGEVVVVDNGSTDGSGEIAARAGARVVEEPRGGYGSALMRGIAAAGAPFIIMADADDSYDLTDLERFITALRAGADVVIGSRRRGTIEPGAMPTLHRWIGNPLFSALLSFLFRVNVSDSHCGMRAFTRQAYDRMQLQTTGMEFASEMVIKAALSDLQIVEIPITLRPDGRGRRAHLRPLRDGWRHLRFILLFSPTYLFLLPGCLLIVLGLLPLIALEGGPRRFAGLSFDVHYMVLGSLLTVLGFQILTMGVFAKVHSHAARLSAPDRLLTLLLRHFNLERGLLAGALLFVLGFGIDAAILMRWLASRMGSLDAVRPALQASTLMIIGAQTVFSSFFLSMLALPRRDPPAP
ncbi:MAG TPA: glycosyltransferase family 2 protein [Candidatus Margulisiibacteriota bacterium]|nr:glycosyltransferase family 2 protein [Candidatus Margulisiibacteriota bacterium]